jgi:hypothetical protein
VRRTEVTVADPRPTDLGGGHGSDVLDQLEVTGRLLAHELVDIHDAVRVVAQNPLHAKR